MRLIRTDADPLVLEEFFDDRIPPYAILSHTWGEDEVSLFDMSTGFATSKAGYAKIKYASDQAAEDGYDYVWVDTCCIDKTSSAELSEAINSMYKWYQKAELCYAFLTDVHNEDTITEEVVSRPGSAFSKSRWFTRGWTLQELIAPSKIVFFNSSWTPFGTKHTLSQVLGVITGINTTILDGSQLIHSVSVAKRMSWASKRQTTRQEDMAYSLIGLFNVSIPLLYGEGKRSFTRLLEEIIKDSDDHSIFAWKASSIPGRRTNRQAGLLAESPADYIDSCDFVPFRDWSDNTPHSITNKGLSIRLELQINADYSIAKAALKCVTKSSGNERVCLWLRRIEGDQWVRVRPNVLHFTSIDSRHLPPESHFKSCTIYVRNDPIQIGANDTITGGLTFQVIFLLAPWILFAPDQFDAFPQSRWKHQIRGPRIQYELTASRMAHGQAGILAYQSPNHPAFYIMVGTTISEKPWCLLKKANIGTTMDDLFFSNTPESDGWTSSIECGKFTVTVFLPEANRRGLQPVLRDSTADSSASNEDRLGVHSVSYRIIVNITLNSAKKESSTARMTNNRFFKMLPSRSSDKF